ncbi:phage tail protein [Methylomagnum sp.]
MDSYLGQIMPFAGNFAPDGWHVCDGSLLTISQYQALYSILGVQYGGDGRTTFALPDLRGRTIIGAGAGPNLTNRPQGAKGGAEGVTLTTAQIPAHTHTLTAQASVAIPATKAFTGTGTTHVPTGNVLAAANDPNSGDVNGYAAASSANTTLGDAATATASFANAPTTPTGGGGPHDNMSPYQVLNWIICINGLYPVRP